MLSYILDFIKYASHIFSIRHVSNYRARLSKGHTGQYLAKQLSDCLKAFGISNKLCC